MKEKHYITSKNVRTVSMEGTTLTVKFVNGRTYEYYDVPEELWDEIEKALSIGAFMQQRIIGKYEFKEIKK